MLLFFVDVIIHYKVYLVFFIFVVCTNHENICTKNFQIYAVVLAVSVSIVKPLVHYIAKLKLLQIGD